MAANRMLWTAGAIASRQAHACSQALCPLAGMVAAGGRSRTAVQQLAWSVGGVRGPKTSTRKVPVILLKDAPNLGFRGEEVAVRPGYARNFLIPQQVVVYATHSNRAEFLQEKDAAERARVAEVARVQRLQRRLTKLDLTIRRHCNEQDKMFGSVTAKNIADKLEKSDLKVSEKDVLLEEPIREVGVFSIKLRLPSGDELPVNVNVVKR